MNHALLTGAGGLVGRALCRVLTTFEAVSFSAPDWDARLAAAPVEGATIFHLAARVDSSDASDDAAFHRDNVDKTRRLAQEGARRGARRLVFVSSVKVYGDESPGRPLRSGDPAAPRDSYARSKLEAERELARISERTGLPLVVVRPPLVLGPASKGNLARIVALADTPWPLPFAAISNRRAFIHVEDLAALLATCGRHEAAPGRTFIAAHEAHFSTPALLSGLRRGLGRPARLFGVAPPMLEAVAGAMGQREPIRRLTRSLECDASETRSALGWVASVGLEPALREIAHAWQQARR